MYRRSLFKTLQNLSSPWKEKVAFRPEGLKGFPLLLVMSTMCALLQMVPNAHALDMRGNASLEARAFKDAPLYSGQKRQDISFSIEPEFHQAWGDNSITLTPFYRYDSADKKRTHFDLREFFFMTYGNDWELRVGFDKVFWGVTEFTHLVDIINQTDSVEGSDGEDKLGQQMVKLSLIRDWGTFEAYLLPGFRARTYPGEGGRLRTPFLVDMGAATYESSQKDKHVDYALRYKGMVGDLDIGLSYFEGTNRDPSLAIAYDVTVIPGAPPTIIPSNFRFNPYYELIKQAGIDLQYIAGEWLWKMEAIKRTGLNAGDYSAATAGLEYTMYGIFGSVADLGLLAEWAWDERGDNATSIANHDIMAGLRLVMNDVKSSEMLVGVIGDYKSGSQLLRIEGNRRINDQWKLEGEAVFYLNVGQNDLLYGVRKDSYLQLSIAYYY